MVMPFFVFWCHFQLCFIKRLGSKWVESMAQNGKRIIAPFRPNPLRMAKGQTQWHWSGIVRCKTASIALVLINDGIEHTVKQNRILHAWLLAREANHTVVRHAPFSLDTKTGIDPLTPFAALDAEHVVIACIGTRFTKCTSVGRKIERRNTRFIQDNNLLFTGSYACFGGTRNALTLKKRFVFGVRGAHHKGRLLRYRCPKGRGEGSEKLSPRCHLLNSRVHDINQVG
jgi:hypothetical protein